MIPEQKEILVEERLKQIKEKIDIKQEDVTMQEAEILDDKDPLHSPVKLTLAVE